MSHSKLLETRAEAAEARVKELEAELERARLTSIVPLPELVKMTAHRDELARHVGQLGKAIEELSQWHSSNGDAENDRRTMDLVVENLRLAARVKELEARSDDLDRRANEYQEWLAELEGLMPKEARSDDLDRRATAQRDELLRMADEYLSHDGPNDTYARRLAALLSRIRRLNK